MKSKVFKIIGVFVLVTALRVQAEEPSVPPAPVSSEPAPPTQTAPPAVETITPAAQTPATEPTSPAAVETKEPEVDSPVPVHHSAPVLSPPSASAPAIRSKRGTKVEKETEGTSAPNRFQADTVIKSQYKFEGEQLEVDPD